jgi:para-aminobenzoate synthetase/4-amino-4-deoxychorismate lyase
MQLLAQIEDEPRGVYTGAIGYFSREHSIFNVAIRTLSLEAGYVTMGVGGGIVIDSDPAAEYRECCLKAEFVANSGEPFSLIETMLWEDGNPLLDVHLDRLEDSADYFGFPCNRAVIQASLLAANSKFSKQPRKVRLLLDRDGTLHVESEVLTDKGSELVKVCLATQRTDPDDRFLFHKTTRRALYNSVLAAAAAAGFDDALFFNSRDELTEGAISNVVVEKAGRWFTPPLDCGVLPGVYRRHLLSSRADIEEKLLTLDDLKSADAVYICNAVRGLRRVSISLDPI